ncbi:MAG: RraA family protein [Chloroflexota bacterium]|nr:RraA family protein [Chloroflexota bacterium]
MNTYELAKKFKYLRTTGIVDGLDAVGRQDLTLMDERIKPLWRGIRFWGPALTVRALPANKADAPLSPEEAIRSHRIWFDEFGGMGVREAVRPDCVVVTGTAGCPETGIWGSNDALEMATGGTVSVLTDGYGRDTDELILQKTPVACRGRGRPITPGSVIFTGVNEPIACGGALVRPGDIVGCDGDGAVVVPAEVARDFAIVARGILIDDARKRRRLYEQNGMAPDETVDVEAMEEFLADL